MKGVMTDEEKLRIEEELKKQNAMFEKLDDDVKNMVIYDEKIYGGTK